MRQISVEDSGGLPVDCRVKFFFAPFNNFVCQTEVRACVKDNKRSVILFRHLEGVTHSYCTVSFPIFHDLLKYDRKIHAKYELS